MRKARLLSIAVCLLILSAGAHAEDYFWTDNGDGTCTITGSTGLDGDVTIPDTLDGLTVITIGDWAFEDCNDLTSVTIPDSVTTIGNSAFEDCWGLTRVTIGSNVTAIGNWAFSLCSGLTSFTIPDSVTTLGDGAFSSCSGLTSVTIPDSVTAIGDSAFESCSDLTSVTIPDSVTAIGDGAFSFCSGMTSVTIGSSVTTIGEGAFYACTGLTSVTIGSSVTTIKTSAFYACWRLTCVIIPDSVTTIGYSGFHNCLGLTCMYFKGEPPNVFPTTFFNVYATVYYLSGTAGWGATFGEPPGELPTAEWPLSIADVDTNGDVNLLDFYTFAAAWQAVNGVDAEYNPLCDISDPVDGVINTADLQVFADNWLITPCP